MTAGSQTNPNGQANSLDKVKLALTDILDEVYQQESKTGMWTPNPAYVRGFQNAKTGQVATISTSGLGKYDPVKGFPEGNAGMVFKDYTLENDRGVSYLLDQVDVMQSANIPVASAVLAEFSRSALVPEVDAIRLSKVATICNTKGRVVNGYAPAEGTMLSTLTDALDKIYDATGIDEGINIHINAKYRKALLKSSEYTKTRNVESAVTTLNSKVTAINDNPITYVPSPRMWSQFDLKDGTTIAPNEGGSGFAPNEGAKEIVALFTAPNTAQGIVAHQITNMFGPEQVQKADGSLINFRVYHDCIIPENKVPGCFAILSDKTPASLAPRVPEAQEVAETARATTKSSKK